MHLNTVSCFDKAVGFLDNFIKHRGPVYSTIWVLLVVGKGGSADA
jgi:hypothetical protein